jgi:hypothetical protein
MFFTVVRVLFGATTDPTAPHGYPSGAAGKPDALSAPVASKFVEVLADQRFINKSKELRPHVL